MAEPAVSTSAPVSTPAPVVSSSDATSSSSTPTKTSTADIAADVIADLESGSNDDSTPPAAPAAVSAKPVTTTVADLVADPDDVDAIPAETVDSLGRKRVNNIPLPRVKQMVTKREQKLLASLAKEMGLTPAEGAELKLDEVIATVKEHGTKRAEYEARFRQIDEVERLIAENPEKFMELVGGIHPIYKEYARKQAATADTKPAPVAGTDDPEPQPDYDLGDGSMTYSLKGMRELRAWDRRQAVKEFDAKFGDRLKPVEDRFKADQTREEEERWLSNVNQQINQRLERARKWPQFVDHEKEMLDAMKADKTLGLEDAYMSIVVPKLAGSRTKMRQEVLAEIEATPKTSSVAVSPTAPKASDKPKTTADIAREVMASLGA